MSWKATGTVNEPTSSLLIDQSQADSLKHQRWACISISVKCLRTKPQRQALTQSLSYIVDMSSLWEAHLSWDNDKLNKEDCNNVSFTTSCRLHDSAAGTPVCLPQVWEKTTGGDFCYDSVHWLWLWMLGKPTKGRVTAASVNLQQTSSWWSNIEDSRRNFGELYLFPSQTDNTASSSFANKCS